MDGWSARAVPGAERSRLSLFLRTLFLRFHPALPPPCPIGALFVNFLPIERLRGGGARQSNAELVFSARMQMGRALSSTLHFRPAIAAADTPGIQIPLFSETLAREFLIKQNRPAPITLAN